MRVHDVAIGDFVAIAKATDRYERFHAENNVCFMVVALERSGRKTVAVVECEDEHIFRVEPARLKPWENQ